MEVDTIVRFIDGTKRYILTAIDVERKFAFAGAYTGHSSASAADFLKKLTHVCPFAFDELQTDNGSEFAKHFERACADLGITHFLQGTPNVGHAFLYHCLAAWYDA